jgi:hypothetical protein
LKTARDDDGNFSRKNWSNRLSGSDFSTAKFSVFVLEFSTL